MDHQWLVFSWPWVQKPNSHSFVCNQNKTNGLGAIERWLWWV